MYKCLQNIDAVILCGGEGTRMKKLFPDIPKCLIKIEGFPFIFSIIKQLNFFGCRRIVLSCNECQSKYFNYFQSKYNLFSLFKTEICYETNRLGTGGAVINCLGNDFCKSDDVLVVNGDSIILNLNLYTFVKEHLRCNYYITIYSVFTKTPGMNMIMNFGDDFDEHAKKHSSKYINAGMYLVNKNILLEHYLDKKQNIDLDVNVVEYIKRIYEDKVGAFVDYEGEFRTIGDPNSYGILMKEIEKL